MQGTARGAEHPSPYLIPSNRDGECGEGDSVRTSTKDSRRSRIGALLANTDDKGEPHCDFYDLLLRFRRNRCDSVCAGDTTEKRPIDTKTLWHPKHTERVNPPASNREVITFMNDTREEKKRSSNNNHIKIITKKKKTVQQRSSENYHMKILTTNTKYAVPVYN